MKNRKICGILLALILCCLAFIWGNSMLPAEKSGAVSGGLLEWIGEHLPFLAGMSEFLLRKLGHLCEFGGTAFLMAWFFTAAGQRGLHRVTMPMLCMLLVAVLDETIQVFIPGRSSMVTDVWIDLLGACAGITVFLIGYAIWRKRILKGKQK